jgi:hypothetical protein
VVSAAIMRMSDDAARHPLSTRHRTEELANEDGPKRREGESINNLRACRIVEFFDWHVQNQDIKEQA